MVYYNSPMGEISSECESIGELVDSMNDFIEQMNDDILISIE
jgi:hypothetical protein